MLGSTPKNLGNLKSALPLGYAQLESLAGLYRLDAEAFECARMQEGVARSIGKFDEPIPLIGIEPFNLAGDWRVGGPSICGSAEGDGTSKLSGGWIEPTFSTTWCCP